MGMNPDIKARWVAALRDPEAKQGRLVLGTADGKRCCLGVLCDIAVADGVIIPPHVYNGTDLMYLGNSTDLPPAVREWAEISSANPIIVLEVSDGNGDGVAAIDANDNLRLTFPQIADLIERNL